MVRRWCGTVGASIGQQRRVPSACNASARFGLLGNSDAVLTVIAHAQYQHVNSWQLGQQAMGLLRQRLLDWRRRCTDSKTWPWRPGLATDTVSTSQHCCRHVPPAPTTRGQGNRDLGPVQALLGQVLEKRHRAAATGYRPGRFATGTDGRATVLCHVIGQAVRQLRWRVPVLGSWAAAPRGSFEFRYRQYEDLPSRVISAMELHPAPRSPPHTAWARHRIFPPGDQLVTPLPRGFDFIFTDKQVLIAAHHFQQQTLVSMGMRALR